MITLCPYPLLWPRNGLVTEQRTNALSSSCGRRRPPVDLRVPQLGLQQLQHREEEVTQEEERRPILDSPSPWAERLLETPLFADGPEEVATACVERLSETPGLADGWEEKATNLAEQDPMKGSCCETSSVTCRGCDITAQEETEVRGVVMLLL